MNIERLKRSIKAHEGHRAEPYYKGPHLIAGWGHNLEETVARGQSYADVWRKVRSRTQHEIWLDEDIEVAIGGAIGYLADGRDASSAGRATWASLTPSRQEVLTEMAFQMGAYGLRTFRKTRAHIVRGNYVAASHEMLDSRWARQTPLRASVLSRRFRDG